MPLAPLDQFKKPPVKLDEVGGEVGDEVAWICPTYTSTSSSTSSKQGFAVGPGWEVGRGGSQQISGLHGFMLADRRPHSRSEDSRDRTARERRADLECPWRPLINSRSLQSNWTKWGTKWGTKWPRYVQLTPRLRPALRPSRALLLVLVGRLAEAAASKSAAYMDLCWRTGDLTHDQRTQGIELLGSVGRILNALGAP